MTYTLQAGRSILRDDKPFISIQRNDNCSPVDADDVAKFICMCLNEKKYAVSDPDFPVHRSHSGS